VTRQRSQTTATAPPCAPQTKHDHPFSGIGAAFGSMRMLRTSVGPVRSHAQHGPRSGSSRCGRPLRWRASAGMAAVLPSSCWGLGVSAATSGVAQHRGRDRPPDARGRRSPR
jgi:hypothetical protein